MDLLIEEIIRLQKGILTKDAIETFNSLKTMPLETLEQRLEDAEVKKNMAFVSTIGHILDYGTINSDLDDFERAVLRDKIQSKSTLEEIKLLLQLFAELRTKIEPSLENHPLAKEHHHFEKMRDLASHQDEGLIKIVKAYPESSLWLPTDTEKGKLLSLYCQIQSLKTADHRLFITTVVPDILARTNNNLSALSLDCLQIYLEGKNITSSNLDKEIQEIHLKAKESMPKADGTLKREYMDTSDYLENAQKEYLALTRKISKYKYPQN